jgi:rod shape-determining protein MreD
MRAEGRIASDCLLLPSALCILPSIMRWLAYFILAYIMLGLQAGLAVHLSIGSAKPNLVVLAVIFIAIFAPRDAAMLGAFVLGFLQDLLTGQALGVYAFSYGLVAMFTVSTQQVVYRGHPLTHFSLALVAQLMTMSVIVLHGLIRGPWLQILPLFYSALYTACLAPMVLGVLGRMKRGFAFQPPRRRVRL